MRCPRCADEHFIRNGKAEQRYKYKSCGFQFTVRHPGASWQCELTVFLYCCDLSMNAIAKMFDVAPSTIMQWIQKFGEQHAHPPEPDTDTAVVVELDEMRHYLKKRKL